MSHGISLPESLWVRRWIAAGVDVLVEMICGVMGGYFGAMLAALTMVLHEVSPQMVQRSIWTGMISGFFFWALSASWINRVIIQGFSRSSIGKKIMELEIVSFGAPISWKVMMRYWLTVSLSGEIRVVFTRDQTGLATVHAIPLRDRKTDSDKKAA